MALQLVLALFDDAVISEATSPATGIQTTAQFKIYPPNPGELKAHCIAIAERQAHIRHEDLPRGFTPRPYSRHFDHLAGTPPPCQADRDRVAAAMARFKAAVKPMVPPPKWQSPTDEQLLAHYGRREPELEPVPFD